MFPDCRSAEVYNSIETFHIVGPSARLCFDRMVKKKSGPIQDFSLDRAAECVFQEMALPQLEGVLHDGFVSSISPAPYLFHHIFFATT